MADQPPIYRQPSLIDSAPEVTSVNGLGKLSSGTYLCEVFSVSDTDTIFLTEEGGHQEVWPEGQAPNLTLGQPVIVEIKVHGAIIDHRTGTVYNCHYGKIREKLSGEHSSLVDAAKFLIKHNIEPGLPVVTSIKDKYSGKELYRCSTQDTP